jgi:hypothetical protein
MEQVMNFKTKDLMVTVLPRLANPDLAKICLLQTHICRHPTLTCARGCTFLLTNNCGLCSIRISLCGHCSLQFSCLQSGGCNFFNSCGADRSACDPTIFCFASDPFVIEHIEDLVAIRAELQDTLKQIDAIQKEGLPSGIGSKAEAAALEASLSEALAQVRSAKKGLT